MSILVYLLVAIVGYLFGCSHMSLYISKIKKIDIKNNGSKNYGASNTVALAGVKAGVLVFIHDTLKAAIPVLLARFLLKEYEYAPALAGCFSVIGHIFPFYLKFDGGKGYAAFIGMSLALFPLFGVIAFVISAIIAILSDLVVLSTFSFIVAIPLYCVFTQNYVVAAIIGAISILIFIKHKENIKNIITRNGKEGSIRESVFKKERRRVEKSQT